MRPAIALLTENTLMGLGLKTLLGEFLPMVEISIFNSFDEFSAVGTERFVHFFVDLKFFVRHRAFFEEQRHKTMLLGRGAGGAFPEMHQIDINMNEERLVHEILKMRQGAHRPEHHLSQPATAPSGELSAREEEVLALVAQGLINKEIADRLGIGLTTVITHRRNIMEKLGIKSVAGLALYAAAMGYIDPNSF